MQYRKMLTGLRHKGATGRWNAWKEISQYCSRCHPHSQIYLDTYTSYGKRHTKGERLKHSQSGRRGGGIKAKHIHTIFIVLFVTEQHCQILSIWKGGVYP